MRIGKLVEAPKGDSNFGIVSDEYGNQWTVDRGEIPEGREAGDDYAYRVDFYSQSSVPLLKRDENLEK